MICCLDWEGPQQWETEHLFVVFVHSKTMIANHLLYTVVSPNYKLVNKPLYIVTPTTTGSYPSYILITILGGTASYGMFPNIRGSTLRVCGDLNHGGLW